MARIIGAIATSHTPTIGYAQDRGLGVDPLWAPIFSAFDPVRTWLEERRRTKAAARETFDLSPGMPRLHAVSDAV